MEVDFLQNVQQSGCNKYGKIFEKFEIMNCSNMLWLWYKYVWFCMDEIRIYIKYALILCSYDYPLKV